MSAYFGRRYRRILDLGVYRCSEEQYRAEQKADCDALILSLDLPTNSRVETSIRDRWRDKHGGPWLGNELVGVISICAGPAHLGAVFCLVNRRITKRTVRGRLFLVGKLLDFNVMFPKPRIHAAAARIARQAETMFMLADLP
jgi:hypothetical protein